MPTFSDYIIFVDESGDHGLAAIDQQYPVFVLAFCMIRKEDYIQTIARQVQEFKFDWFGHDQVVLHEHEIRRSEKPFVFLGDRARKERFMASLNAIIEAAPMHIVAAVIRKDALAQRYATPSNPYPMALLFCMERAHAFLTARNQPHDAVTHIVAESRGRLEDAGLELEFRRISDGVNFLSRRPIPGFDLLFADKKTNSTGLQIADLLARPIGLSIIRPEQNNRAFEMIHPKMYDLKVFP